MKGKSILRNFSRIVGIIVHENKRYFAASILLDLSSSIYPFINIFLLKYLIEAIEVGVSFVDFIKLAVFAVAMNLLDVYKRQVSGRARYCPTGRNFSGDLCGGGALGCRSAGSEG